VKHVETLFLEIQVSDDGLEQVRRKDRKPLTNEDFKEARRFLDNLPGITVNDVLRVFPGAKVVNQKE
jgi:hypothetical protein